MGILVVLETLVPSTITHLLLGEVKDMLKIESIQWQADTQVHVSYRYPYESKEDTGELYTMFIAGVNFAYFTDLLDEYLLEGEDSELGTVLMSLVEEEQAE